MRAAYDFFGYGNIYIYVFHIYSCHSRTSFTCSYKLDLLEIINNTNFSYLLQVQTHGLLFSTVLDNASYYMISLGKVADSILVSYIYFF